MSPGIAWQQIESRSTFLAISRVFEPVVYPESQLEIYFIVETYRQIELHLLGGPLRDTLMKV